MFVIDDTIVTAPLSDTILDGVTRDSLLTLAREMGLKVEERKLSVKELENSFRDNGITEAFGVGTAAVVAPIGTIGIGEVDYRLPEYTSSAIQFKLAARLEDIRRGRAEDVYGWNSRVS